MKTPAIENVHADNLRESCCGIGWRIAGQPDRYHVWVDLKTGRILEGSWFYRNPPLALKRGDPGYFDTRSHNPDAKVNAPMIAAVLAIVERDQLIDKLIADEAAKAVREARLGELYTEMHALEASALEHWLAGKFSMSPAATRLLEQHKRLALEIDKHSPAQGEAA
jgi:hypothetical protein